jgi:hypothetical protein
MGEYAGSSAAFPDPTIAAPPSPPPDAALSPSGGPATWHNIRRQLSDLDTLPLKRLVKTRMRRASIDQLTVGAGDGVVVVAVAVLVPIEESRVAAGSRDVVVLAAGARGVEVLGAGARGAEVPVAGPKGAGVLVASSGVMEVLVLGSGVMKVLVVGPKDAEDGAGRSVVVISSWKQVRTRDTTQAKGPRTGLRLKTST